MYRLLAGAGIGTVPSEVATTPEEAVRAAESIGYPVVCKILSPDILHKSKLGGVAMDLYSADQVRVAFSRILSSVGRARPEARIEGCLVCGQAPKGLAEIIIGSSVDEEFGPVVMFGVGGEFAEVLRKVEFGSIPVDLEDATRMVRRVQKTMGAAQGWGRMNPLVVAGLIHRFSQLASAHPETESIDLNPVIVYEDRCVVVDAKGTLCQ